MKVKTKIYASALDPAAKAQFEDAIKQPYVVQGAVMPDGHKGYSLPIGAVVATKDHIVPSWVGYDIGCGMCAIQLNGVNIEDVKTHSKSIFDEIYRHIPVGFNKNKSEMDYDISDLTIEGQAIAINKEYKHAIGTLGGGNHFIEIGHDEDTNIWIVIHSGSRGVGHGIAAHYMKLASSDIDVLKKEFKANHLSLLKHAPEKFHSYEAKYIAKKSNRLRPKEGHYSFDVNTKNGKDYINDLNWALDYALANRLEMIKRVVQVMTKFVDVDSVDYNTVINKNHNHAVLDDGLWIHRKGATQADKGMLGVIPGNMKDGSFIVKGKGNPDSLKSSSHGAGRVLGRIKAKAVLKMDDFKEQMQGIMALVEEGTLDESQLVYKDIFQVMAEQTDLVEVLHHIKPLINIKSK